MSKKSVTSKPADRPVWACSCWLGGLPRASTLSHHFPLAGRADEGRSQDFRAPAPERQRSFQWWPSEAKKDKGPAMELLTGKDKLSPSWARGTVWLCRKWGGRQESLRAPEWPACHGVPLSASVSASARKTLGEGVLINHISGGVLLIILGMELSSNGTRLSGPETSETVPQITFHPLKPFISSHSPGKLTGSCQRTHV